MFFPKEMTEVDLIVPSKDLFAVTKILSGYGVFHQVDSTYLGLEDLGPSTWVETAADYASMERRIQVIMQILNFQEQQKASSEFDTVVDLNVVTSVVEKLEEDVNSAYNELQTEKKGLELLESQLRQLEPIAEIEVDVSALQKSSFLYSVLGIIPAANIKRLKTSLARVPHVFLTLREDSKEPVVWIMGPRSNSDIIDRAIKSAYLNPLSMPEEFRGTPEQITRIIHKEIKSSKHKISELESKLTKLAGTHKKELQKLWWEVHVSRLMVDAIVRFGQLRHTYVVVGWVPTSDLDLFKQRLKQASKETLIEAIPAERTGQHENVPIEMANNKWLKPFELLLTTFGRPSYSEIDPTILLALTFPLLFGMMFGDVGQGLVLLTFGLLIHTGKILKAMSSLGLLIVYCGASATIFGFLYGSIFSFEGHLIEKFLGFKLDPIWISPVHDILPILIFTIDIGVILIILGFLLGVFNYIRARKWAHMIIGHNSLNSLVLYVSLLGLAGPALAESPLALKSAIAIGSISLPYATMALISGLFVIFSGVMINLIGRQRPLIEGGLSTYMIQAPMELFETVISFLSNTLSYVRVGAFAVAHGGLSLAIFSIAGPESNLGFWITIVIGNLFIIGFEGMIVGIQTMRLHYYEFLGKFFHGGGKQFEPLRLVPSKEG